MLQGLNPKAVEVWLPFSGGKRD